MTARDLCGERFGRLLVVEKTGERRNRKPEWRCVCDCGKAHIALAGNLNAGRTQSCGCLRMEVSRDRRRLPPGVGGFNNILGNYQRGARLRGLAWDLTDEQARGILTATCHYCGAAPANRRGTCGSTTEVGWDHSAFTYSGIDRKDNDVGYTPQNCVPCCKACNYAKRDRDYTEFVTWLKRAGAHLETTG